MASAASSLYIFPSLFYLLCHLVAARDFLVGGDADSWSSSPQLLSRWAHANRFQVNDSLVWKEGPVTKESYAACNRSSPVAEYRSAVTVTLTRSGPHYFISGKEGECEKGVKLVVVVMAERWRPAVAFSPAPSPVEAEAPAPMVAGAAPFSAAPGGAIIAAGLCLWALLAGLCWHTQKFSLSLSHCCL